MEPVKVGSAVLIWRDGRILMGQRRGAHGADTWSIPGGKLDFGESWPDCVAREAREETGVEIHNIRYLATTNDIFDESKHFVTIWMQADWLSGEPRITEPDKYVDHGWYSLHDMPQPLFQPCWKNLKATVPELFTEPRQ